MTVPSVFWLTVLLKIADGANLSQFIMLKLVCIFVTASLNSRGVVCNLKLCLCFFLHCKFLHEDVLLHAMKQVLIFLFCTFPSDDPIW